LGPGLSIAAPPSKWGDRFASLARGRDLREPGIGLRFLPAYDLRRNSVSTFFCTPAFIAGGSDIICGYRAFLNIDTRDLPLLDCAILELAVGFARTLGRAGIVAAVSASVNFETLACPRGRALYLGALLHFGAAHNRHLVVTVEEIPPGTPSGRLFDMIVCLRAYVRRVFVHLSERDPRLAGEGRVGATGIMTSLPQRATRAVTMGLAKSLVRVCDTQSAVSCIDCVESETELDIVRAIGVRYAAGKIFAERGLRADTPIAAIHKLLATPHGRVIGPAIGFP